MRASGEESCAESDAPTILYGHGLCESQVSQGALDSVDQLSPGSPGNGMIVTNDVDGDEEAKSGVEATSPMLPISDRPHQQRGPWRVCAIHPDGCPPNCRRERYWFVCPRCFYCEEDDQSDDSYDSYDDDDDDGYDGDDDNDEAPLSHPSDMDLVMKPNDDHDDDQPPKIRKRHRPVQDAQEVEEIKNLVEQVVLLEDAILNGHVSHCRCFRGMRAGYADLGDLSDSD